MILDSRASTDPEYTELASGLVVPSWIAEVQKSPVAVDLFCGCGGMSLGMMQAGWHVAAAVDNSVEATLTYLQNLGAYPLQFHFIEPCDGDRMEKYLEKQMLGGKRNGKLREGFVSGGNREALGDFPGVGHFFFGDIGKLRGRDILDAIGLEKGELDCVCGSPPCQGFSSAGKQRVEDPRNSLVFEFARLVVEMLPKTMVFENVPGILQMVTPDGVPVVDQLCQILADGGFSTVDALQRVLRARTGTFGAMRGQRPARKAPAKTPRKAKRPAQRALFAEARP